MVTRRQGREWAVQMLVQFDLNQPESLDAAIEAFWDQQIQLEAEMLADGEGRVPRIVFSTPDPGEKEALSETRAFTEARVRGVCADREMLDARIGEHLRNWSLYRLGTVERNVLRLGAWELIHCADIPAPILVNEAIDLAKFFSETKSGKFVNGVLDNLAKSLRSGSAAETFTPACG